MNSTMQKNIFRFAGSGLTLLACAWFAVPAQAAVINKTVCVRNVNLTLSGNSVPFWGFTENCGGGGGGGGMGGGVVPGPVIEIGTGDTLNLTLNMMMAPQEPAPYNGHTIHMHGADVSTVEDGVPETGAPVNGDIYTWKPTSNMAGSYIYHCHVHTVKHLEMGMYGALIVRPKNASGAFLNQLTTNSATAYDYIQTYLYSSVDPAYHYATGDSTVFADYNPAYFLLNGKEGKTSTAPAATLQAATGKRVALRIIGVHSVNGTFRLTDSSGKLMPFTVHVQDGRAWPTPMTVTSLDVSPGGRFDIIFTTPSSSGTWYPQFTFKGLRGGAPYGTVYSSVKF